MLIYFLRHGLTEYNAEKRYQGQRDIPLSAAGRAMLRKADIEPRTVYITPLCRTRQTAEVLFPTAKLVVVDDLKEMCFGSFEGRNYIEMEHDPDYLAWVAANCESPCPDGETKAVFSERVCRAFAALVDKALPKGAQVIRYYLSARAWSSVCIAETTVLTSSPFAILERPLTMMVSASLRLICVPGRSFAVSIALT